MVKGVERGVEIRSVRLLSKSGGKSGEWIRHDPPNAGGAGGGGAATGEGQPAARPHTSSRSAGRIKPKPPRGG